MCVCGRHMYMYVNVSVYLFVYIYYIHKIIHIIYIYIYAVSMYGCAFRHAFVVVIECVQLPLNLSEVIDLWKPYVAVVRGISFCC